jgi:transposase-like protein
VILPNPDTMQTHRRKGEARMRQISPIATILTAEPMPAPDLERYLWWQRMARLYGAGLMSRAEAARVLGIDAQTVERRIWTGHLSRVSPSGRPRDALVPVAEVLALAEDAHQQNRETAQLDSDVSADVPSARELAERKRPRIHDMRPEKAANRRDCDSYERGDDTHR